MTAMRAQSCFLCDGGGCSAVLQLSQSKVTPRELIDEAANVAATVLGWSRIVGKKATDVEHYCADCTKKRQLVCVRCGQDDCFCMGGPFFDRRAP